MPGFELIGPEEQAAVNRVFQQGGALGRYGMDARRGGVFRVAEFEKRFAEYMGVGYAQAVSSGTAAVRVALSPLELQPGDEVVTQCFTFVATVEAIVEAGGTPILTEVDETLNMDPADLERKITDRTRAIVPVHMLGAPARMDEILAIGAKHGIPIVEDSAEAPGSSYHGRKTGSMGMAGCFSFDPVKVLTTGEGGMVITNDEQTYRYLCDFADHGHIHDPSVPRGSDAHRISGFNYRMMELSGAIGLVQLGRLDKVLARQRASKARIVDELNQQELMGPGLLRFREDVDPDGDGGDTLVFFAPTAQQARGIESHLASKGIGTKILPEALNWHFAGNWTHLLSQHPGYEGRDLPSLWPQSGDLLHRAIALPIGVLMTEQEAVDVAHAVGEAVERHQHA